MVKFEISEKELKWLLKTLENVPLTDEQWNFYKRLEKTLARM